MVYQTVSDQNQVFQRVFCLMKEFNNGDGFIHEELLPPFRRVLGRMLAVLCAKHFGFPTLLKGAVISEYAQN